MRKQLWLVTTTFCHKRKSDTSSTDESTAGELEQTLGEKTSEQIEIEIPHRRQASVTLVTGSNRQSAENPRATRIQGTEACNGLV